MMSAWSVLLFVYTFQLFQAHSYFNWYYEELGDDGDTKPAEGNKESDRDRATETNDQELAKKFAPYLHFDPKNTEFPMNPEIFYKYEMKRDYAQQMNNHVMDTKTNPTYYRVIECSSTHLVIDYWWFYGYQGECNKIVPKFIRDRHPKISSRHNGDWEHVMIDINVKIKPAEDEYTMNKVIFNAHGDHWTKKLGEFELNGKKDKTHPNVYAGKIQKGSYHNAHKTLLLECLFWDDQRRKGGKILKTEENLVNLDKCSDKWCKYYRSDKNPKMKWGPKGKNGIGTNPVPKPESGSESHCKVSECDGTACQESWQSKFDKHGKKIRGGLEKVGGFFKKTGGKIKKFFGDLFNAEMGYDDYSQYYYDDDDDDDDLYEALLEELYGDQDMDDSDGYFGAYYYYLPQWFSQQGVKKKY